MRITTLLLSLSLSLSLTLAACGGEEETSSTEPAAEEPAEATPTEPAAEEPAAEEAAPAQSACARVSECCTTMGQQWGGGSQRDCQAAATGGDEQACADYLSRNAEINTTEDHPLHGRVFPECMPAN